MDPHSNILNNLIDSADDKRKIMKLLDENSNILIHSTEDDSLSSESSEDSTDEDSSTSSNSSIPLRKNKKRKKRNSSKRSQHKENKKKKRKDKAKPKSHDSGKRRNGIVSSHKNGDILSEVSKAVSIANESLSDLSKSVMKLEQNVNQVEMLNGSHIQYTMDTLPTFPDGTSCIKFQSKDAVLFVPLKTPNDVNIFEKMLEDPVLCNQAVSFFTNYKFSDKIYNSNNVCD